MELRCLWSRATVIVVAILGIAFGVMVLQGADGGDKLGGAFGVICVVISPLIAAQGRYPIWRCGACGKKYCDKTSRLFSFKRAARSAQVFLLVIALIWSILLVLILAIGWFVDFRS